MKSFLGLSFILLFAFILFSCDILDPEEDPNELGGDVNMPLSQVGNTASASFFVGDPDNYANDVDVSAVIRSNNNGIVDVKLTADLSKYPEIYNLIPERSKAGNGKVVAGLKFKMTTEGWQDFFFNKDGAAHTMFKYDCKVGDKYSYTQSDGKTITRTVIAKSEEEDFDYGLWLIKTITIEQNSITPGIKKYIYRANHRFGLVYFEAILEDGSSTGGYIFTKYDNG